MPRCCLTAGLHALTCSRARLRIARLLRLHCDDHLQSLWLVRSTADGGTEYVCFRGASETVEMLEGFHLPPQMPFIKKRRWLNRSEALSCRQNLERSQGFRHGSALF